MCAALVALFLPLLSACTVPIGGAVAIGTAADGDLVAHVHMCEGRVDGATLYRSDVEGTPTVASWDVAEAVTDTARFSLDRGGDGWTVTTPMPALEPEARYHLYARTKDGSWSAQGPDFTLAELQALGPGEVLYWNGDWGADQNTPTNAVADLAEFASDACT